MRRCVAREDSGPRVSLARAGRARAGETVTAASRRPKLSFCMPTYNYGRYIGNAVESIRSQSGDDVELVVLDGGSTDDTERVVRAIAASWPALRYVRQATRGGIDADLARSVELATGEYCWLLSADDALAEGAVRRILQEFDGGSDIVLCNRLWCDIELRPVNPQSWLEDSVPDTTFDLSQRKELERYLDSARSLGALFSFMSCIGFKRDVWLSARAAMQAPATCYMHAGRLLATARRGARVKYVSTPLVLCRGGMDSFRADGLAARLLIDLRGFLALADGIFADDAAARASFLRVLKREHPWWRWVRVRAGTASRDTWREIERHLAMYGFTAAQRLLINLLGMGFGAARSVRSGLRRAASS
jgi:O-antigen biosynthesis alpha-1,3-abequosyltransferase